MLFAAQSLTVSAADSSENRLGRACCSPTASITGELPRSIPKLFFELRRIPSDNVAEANEVTTTQPAVAIVMARPVRNTAVASM